MSRLIDDDRQPVRHLNYGADVHPDPTSPMGPNLLGEFLFPVTAERTATGTRVGFSFIPPKSEESR